ncbi:MAG: alpha/beta fold hydrolase [Caulobacteraceae bacterium]|nr:alpha/beta fold hydrolase [Caulobacteraceae bacterium]
MIRSLLLAFAASALLVGCAPMVQQAGHPDLTFTGPRLDPHEVVSFDGARLGLRRWEPATGEPWAVIIGLHGMNDYSNAFHLAGPYWAERGIVTLAYDQRGFGRSPQRGVWAGQALMEEDLRTVVSLARQRYPHAIIAVVGESMGGAVAITAFASARPPPADRLILVSPAVWGWSSQPVMNRVALWLFAHVDGPAVLQPPSFVYRHIRASDNIEELIRMGRDPQMLWGARTDTLYGLVGLMQNGWREVGSAPVPTALLAGVHDQIIPKAPMLQAARKLRPTDRSAYYPDGWHLLLVDKQAPVVWRDIEGFLRDPAASLVSGTEPVPGAPPTPAAETAGVSVSASPARTRDSELARP